MQNTIKFKSDTILEKEAKISATEQERDHFKAEFHRLENQKSNVENKLA